MILGLLADIHEAVEQLDRAIGVLGRRRVDRFLVLGDVYDSGKRLDETAARLDQLDAAGVWGNHDFGLCRGVDDWVRSRFSPRTLAYFATLRPRVVLDGCLFQHIEPHLDPEQLEDLWSYGGEGGLDPARSPADCPHARAFMGHLHRWEVRDEAGRVDWDGSGPLVLEPGRRWLAVIHAVRDGYCAAYDTVENVLEPFRLG